MMGEKAVEPKLYLSFSLDAAVPGDHLVRRLADALDLSFVRGLARPYYSGTGRPSVDPLVLFKLSLLGYLFNITSERRLCEEAGLNLAWRWFLGYELDEPIPDHSVLSKARKRFGPPVYERFFKRVVAVCEQRGLVQGDVLFLDATLSKANASEKSFRSRALTQELSPPETFVAELWAVNEDEPAEELPPPREKRRGGRPPKADAKWRQGKSITNSLNVSRTDPDAQMFHKFGQPATLSHKTHFGVDGGKAGVITAVGVAPSCEADSQVVGKMLDKHAAAVGRPVRELVGDRGYGSEAAQRACAARGVTGTLGMRTLANRHGSFNRDRFTYDADSDTFVCPNGQELVRFVENFQLRVSLYRPPRGTCRTCPFKAQCAPGVADRSVTRRWDADLWTTWTTHMQSRHARRMMRRRQEVSERAFADGKEKHGLARAQFRGRGKMRIQALLTATAMNLKKLVRFGPVAHAGMAVAIPVVTEQTRRPLAGLRGDLSVVESRALAFQRAQHAGSAVTS